MAKNNSSLPIGDKEPKRGDRVRAKDIQNLNRNIKRLSRQTGVTYATAFPITKQPFFPTLRTVRDSDPVAYEINVKQGYVIENVIVGTKSLTYHLPLNIMDGNDTVWQEIEDGQCVYCFYNVEKDGTIITASGSEPTIVIDDDDIDNEHYRPDAFSSTGANGEKKVKIAKFEIVASKPKLTLFAAGDHIEHYAERSTWANYATSATGEKYSIGKNYDEASDTYNLKKLVQLASGKPIVKPYQGGESDDNMDHVPIRSISERATGAQVTVTAATSDNTILVAGNNYGSSGSPVSVTNSRVTMSVIDGLVTSLAAGSGGTGWWGTVSWLFTPAGGGGSSQNIVLTFEDGILTDVTLDGAPITGTEASQGDAEIEVNF